MVGTLGSLKNQIGDPSRMRNGMTSRGDPNFPTNPTPNYPSDPDPRQEGLTKALRQAKCGKQGTPDDTVGGLAPSRGDWALKGAPEP